LCSRKILRRRRCPPYQILEADYAGAPGIRSLPRGAGTGSLA
jgi:hypothetical protein